MNEQIVILTLFACGLTLMVVPWFEKKLDDYLFKRKLKNYGIGSSGNRYLDRFRLLHKLPENSLSVDDFEFLSAAFEYTSILMDEFDYD